MPMLIQNITSAFYHSGLFRQRWMYPQTSHFCFTWNPALPRIRNLPLFPQKQRPCQAVNDIFQLY